MGVVAKSQSTEFKPKIDYKTNRSGPKRWIFSHVWSHKLLLLVMVVLQFVATLSANLIPGVIGGLVDLYDRGELDLDELTSQSILILILGVSVGVLLLIRNFAVEF
ncbi:MAG: hypothetical protein ACXADH_04840 [Candidatus Kariarchaeaceae archaeon]|jgi:ABC-type multidrug transport system fused ATPase/permease subunit